MSLFQNSVLNKYLKGIDTHKAEKAWNTFKTHFHNSEIQENIRNSKEEQYQGEFLIDLFVNVFGYVKKPNPNFNLTTELKNIKGAKKTDGAILQDEKAIAVIELKGTNTVDLAKVENQAFGYKNNQPGCTYVITSNFEKLRFYIDNAVEFEEFNLFQITKERFNTLYLCLSQENLLKGIPKQIKDESLTREETVTKQLYKDYSQFRNEIFDDIQKQNPEYDKLTLFKKTQKLLDRFLFIFFAEDRLLLPPNSIREIVTQWTDLRDKYDEYQPLYSRFKKYFGYMNTGYEGKKYEIFAYNGGLFASDEILDTIKISDDLLYKHTVNLSNYDFESEVSVNILGHIFEHSLTEIETIQAQLEGHEIDKSKTKRKKDGVFYTPKYITKYIVDNTVGKLCDEKKAEIGLDENEFNKDRKGRKKATLKKLSQQLDDYRNWLLKITICDPACGSGAFLNQALEFLIEEHKYIDELKAKLLGDALIFSEVQNDILENNIFGVDINEESVEIAKLSLWLRTAKKGRKLTSLNSNVKCGNSLINDTNIATDKVFKWKEEFPVVFQKGGFDVIIGNPPYVKRQNLSNNAEIEFLEQNYISATYNFDLYLLFIERGSKLLNQSGILSYINPSKFTTTKTGEGVRKYLIENCHITSFVNFKEYQVFEDATTYCCILTLENGSFGATQFLELNELSPKKISTYKNYTLQIESSQSGLGWNIKPALKIHGDCVLGDLVDTFTGIESGADSIYILPKNSNDLGELMRYENDIIFPTLKGSNLERYFFEPNPYYSIVPYRHKNLIQYEELQDKYPEVVSYLNKHAEEIKGREKGKMNNDSWYGYVYPKNLHKYQNDRLIWTDISIMPQFVIDKSQSWHVRTVCSLELKDKDMAGSINLEFLQGLLNSRLFYNFIQSNSNTVRGGYYRYKPQYVKRFPIILSKPTIQNRISEMSVKQQLATIEKNKLKSKFLKRVKDNLEIEKISKKLESFYDHEFKVFVSELKKQKINLTLLKQDEWLEYFEQYVKEINQIKAEIKYTDVEIDRHVFQMYELTDEEIKIVNESNA